MKRMAMAMAWALCYAAVQVPADARVQVVGYSGGKTMGIIELASGHNTFDTVVFGGGLSISTYAAYSFLTVCGAGGEAGLMVRPLAGTAGMVDRLDTSWQRSTIFPSTLLGLGIVPSNGMYLSVGDTAKYSGLAVANLIHSASQCRWIDYSLVNGFNRIIYYAGPVFYAKIQIYGYTDTTLGSTPFTMETRLLTVRIRYVLSDNMNDLGGDPVPILRFPKKHFEPYSQRYLDARGRRIKPLQTQPVLKLP